MARRQFLQIAPTAAAMGAGLSMAASGPAQDHPQGVDADNVKTPRLYPGCCAYSYDPIFKRGQMTLEEFIRKAVELRLDAADMTVYYLKSADPAYLADLRHLAYKHALAFSGAACGVSMVQADPAQRAQALTDIKNWVDVADHLGASHLRVFAGKLHAGVALPQSIDWVVDAMKAVSDYSGKKGITIGLEDHAGVTQSAPVCLEIMRRVNSPYAGINLDITHFIPTPDQDGYAQIASCIPYATNTHIRDHFDDGTPIDMDRVWRMFADAGYKGYMLAEYEAKYAGGEDPMTGVPKLVAKIRALCQKHSSV
jgi:sugar phosphate isomerase/epimerase